MVEVKRFGFINNEEDPYVYKKSSGNAHEFLVVYVDNIFFIRNDISMLQV